MAQRTCVIDGCDKPARSQAADWCKMHYHRWYRHGCTEKTAARTDITVSKGRRYRRMHAPRHPLAMANGMVYVHRKVLYDEIGQGPHRCHWCARSIDWLDKGHPDNLVPDHLNSDGADNRPENLVPSCMACNTTRGSQAKADALRAAGWWSNHDTIAYTASQQRRPRVA